MAAIPELSVLTGLPSPTRSKRSQSISSDRPSLAGYGEIPSPPMNVTPDPGFIAVSAASQIVTNDHDSQAESWFDEHGIEPSGETALVAPQSLKLVNRFLDQLLYNFLSISKSTSLAALRPAVAEVLKPKLAAGAISGADQELNEYLGGGDDEEFLALQNGLEGNGDWDLELVWKRTRLRCMVYSSLGDMEEEDEDYHTEQEHLGGPPGTSIRHSRMPGIVSPAVAIFLTSVLEFMGEQVLIVAGQAAYHRLRTKHSRKEKDGMSTPSDIAERVVVEDYDVEKVGMDRTLGRLWRGWKKRIRSPNNSVSMSRSFSRETLHSAQSPSRVPIISPEMPRYEERRPSLSAILAESENAAKIPLPMRPNDIREIEVPGLAIHSDEEDDGESSEDEGYDVPTRPRSFAMFDYVPLSPVSLSKQYSSPEAKRKRSNSTPQPKPSTYISPKPIKSPVQDADNIPTENVADGLSSKEVVENNETPKSMESEQEPPAEEETSPESSSLMGGVVAGVTGVMAVSAAVVTGVIAAATYHPATPLPPTEEVEEEEEPEIMTSSRVSMSGRASPEETNGISRRSSNRSSVHPLRLIDVASSKGLYRSLDSPVDATDMTTGRSMSRSSSAHSQLLVDTQSPRTGSPVSRGFAASPIFRNGSSMSTSRVRNSTEDSIAEVEEKEAGRSQTITGIEGDLHARTAVASDFAGAMQGVDVETHRSPIELGDSIQHSSLDRGQPSGTLLPADSPLHLLGLSSQTPVTGRQASVEHGAPPLTPLREMMEGALDTSDDSSGIATSNGSFAEKGINGRSSSASMDAQTPKATDQRPGRSSAQSNRNSPPYAVRPSTNQTVVPDSPPRATRRHTSESQSSSNSIKMRVTRTSEEGNKNETFEQLIQSDQTIQYTLTPQNMRDMETPDSPRNVMPYTVAKSQDYRPITGRSHSSSISKLNGLRSNQHAASITSVDSEQTSKQAPRTNAPAPQTGARVRMNGPQARGARIERDSMGDFTEFIRSTGPVSSFQPTPAITSAYPSRNISHKGAGGSARNVSGTVPRVGAVATLPRRADSTAGRNRLQARDAVVPRGDSISDLIDFVRSGPQVDRETHRIPRTVAPFRSTMDSDQMVGAVGGKAVDASFPDRYSQAANSVYSSAPGTRYSQASNSVNSSITSNAPLLRNKPLPNFKENDFDEEDMMPKRKTRRVRDPYAIDFSDEEEEYAALTGSRPKPIEEESLADFLRNAPPPPPEPVAPTSVFTDVPRPGSKGLKSKSSSTSILSRFGRSNTSLSQASKSRKDQDITPTSSRPPVPPVPVPAPSAYSSSNASLNTANNNGNSAARPETGKSKVLQKSYQPREAVYTQNSRTTDLADFLMRSEPPSSMATQPQTFQPTVQKEESSAFYRMFGRKKVH